MLCLVGLARRQAGLPPLTPVDPLAGSAGLKSHDIFACDDFSHFACGNPFSLRIHESGYTSVPCWRIGENIAWGRGQLGTPRAIFRALMRSRTHRENILGDYQHIGIDSSFGSLGLLGPVTVWTQHFGAHCATA